MRKPKELDFWSCTSEILNHMRSGGDGVLCTVADKAGKHNRYRVYTFGRLQ